MPELKDKGKLTFYLAFPVAKSPYYRLYTYTTTDRIATTRKAIQQLNNSTKDEPPVQPTYFLTLLTSRCVSLNQNECLTQTFERGDSTQNLSDAN